MIIGTLLLDTALIIWLFAVKPWNVVAVRRGAMTFVIAQTLFYAWLTWRLGADYRIFMFNFSLPYVGVSLLIVSFVAFLKRARKGALSLRIVAFLVIAAPRLFLTLDPIIALQDPEVGLAWKVVWLAWLLVPFSLCVVAPLCALLEQGKRLSEAHLPISHLMVPTHLLTILTGYTMYFVGLFVISSVMAKPITLVSIGDTQDFFVSVLICMPFLVLVDQFALILLPDTLFGEEAGESLGQFVRILILTLIYSSWRLPVGQSEVLWSFFFGLIFATLYVRTRSLVPGIILQGLYMCLLARQV